MSRVRRPILIARRKPGNDMVSENLVRFIVNRSLEDYILIGVDFLPFLKKDKQNPLAH